MREYFQDLEDQILAPYALKSNTSLGRQYPEPHCPHRTIFQRDRDRIIHAKAFRRLKHKTQVFIATESDHYRSRLTHTLEVAQISRHIARILRLNEDVCEGIALAHDLGHTPFGHAGERELNHLMKDFGGFEHNRQSRRIVDELENKYPLFPGLNLSFEIREGLIKHSTPETPHFHKTFISLEAQVVNLADEIAYNNHDLDDGLSSHILDIDDLRKNVTLFKEALESIQSRHTNLSLDHLRTLIHSYLVSAQINCVVSTSLTNIRTAHIQTIADIQALKKPTISLNTEMIQKNKELRQYLFKQFYSHPNVYRMSKKGQLLIRHLFTAFTNDRQLLPAKYREKLQKAEIKERVICDYIAGMTDTFAQREYDIILG